MPITADVHLHSHHSSDSEAKMEEHISKAIDLGLKHLCFTEHHDADFPHHEGDPENMFQLNADSYLYELATLKEKYKDRINILFGLELGLQPSAVRQNLIFSKAHDYDFIIGSSHLCHGKDPYYSSFYEGRTDKEAFREYFESILENIKLFHNFDVYGHLDYVVRYAPEQNKNYFAKDYQDILDAILTTLIEDEKGIEVNSAGFRKGINTTNPCFDIIKRYKELGGEIITIGSDAHAATDLHADFDKVECLCKDAGFKYYCVFENRQPFYYKF